MKRTPLALIFLIVFIDLLGFGIIIPILPSYAQRGFAADDVTVGFLVASYSFMQLVFTPIWGRLSDKIGRKPVLLLGLFLTMAGYVMFGLAHTLVFLFATGDLARPETMSFLQQLPNRILQKPLEVETVRRVLGQAIEGAAPRSA